MTHIFRSCIFLMIVLAGFSAAALDVPFLAGRVNDHAGLLSPETRTILEDQLAAHEAATSNQVVVLTLPSLEGESLEDYSVRVATTWKLGQKEKDNGVLLLISKGDRKMRIEVGYGLEGVLTDALSSQIIRNEITPAFKQGDFDGGISSGVDAILKSIAGEYQMSEETGSSEMDLAGKLFMGGMFVFVVGLFTTLGLFLEGSPGWFLYLFLAIFWLVFPMAILGMKGGLVAFSSYMVSFPILRRIITQTRKKNPKAFKRFFSGFATSTWSSGSSSGGSSSGWSSSSSSSFSGGGGSFGGGGSSGSW